ncbi:MAG: TonB-dependent receptor [Burkholderiales bacterium]|nr:TonB-dependent receptor [Burkholderiales bacterium]
METLASRRAKPLAALLAAIVVTPVAAQTSSVTSPRVDIIGTDKSEIERIPGSAYVVDKETLESSRVFTTNEALRKVPGINVRDEEGLGLRPNIGIRGLNPTRSTKVTLLEDGVPLAYAPYGDNASYYHPPIDRYERIEVLKGAGQVMYGPQTIGGVINYITPTPPEEFRGMIGLAGGNRDYGNARVQLGGAGFLLDYSYKQADGARDNIHSQLNDLNLKKVFSISERQGLTLRANYYSEESQVTYSGLTTAEFNRFGSRYNPFKNDSFDTRRFGLSATHEFAFSDDAKLTTNVYASWFSRDWWRQSSTTTDTQCGNAFRDARLAGDAVNVDACNSIQGRLRDYFTYGIEPRMHVNWAGFGTTSELDFGVKLHFEEQKRKQINAANPFARTGALGEDNVRNTSAYSAFVMNKFILGRFSLSPGLRYEYIDSERTNYPNTGNTNYSSGKSSLDAWIPSLGGTFQAHETTTVFAGIHRGFAPPRTEDIINTGQGPVPTFVDVGAEKSWNSEIGLRSTPVTGMNVQATWFRNDFERLIAVCSIAGGSTSI